MLRPTEVATVGAMAGMSAASPDSRELFASGDQQPLAQPQTTHATDLVLGRLAAADGGAGRLRPADGARTGRDAPVRPSQLVAAPLAGPPPVAPGHRAPRAGTVRPRAPVYPRSPAYGRLTSCMNPLRRLFS